MAAKTIFVLCAAVLVQSAYTACLGGFGTGFGFKGLANGFGAPGFAYDGFYDGIAPGFAAPGLAFDGIAPGFAAPGLAFDGLYDKGCGCYAGLASTGGGLPCASASPIPPVGVTVVSDNAYEGNLAAAGNLPFLGTVGVEGVLPTAGAGAVSYGCGNSYCAMGAEEGPIATGIAPHAPLPAYSSYGFDGIGPYNSAYKGFDGPYGIGYGYAKYGSGCGCGAVY